MLFQVKIYDKNGELIEVVSNPEIREFKDIEINEEELDAIIDNYDIDGVEDESLS